MMRPGPRFSIRHLGFVPLVLGLGWTANAEGLPPLPATGLERLDLPKVKEPSGICSHTARGTLFVADDQGVVCELDREGNIRRRKTFRSADFEGITHDPATGLLYLAIEGEESILEVDPESLEARRKFALPRAVGGRELMKAGGQGIEAITFAPDEHHPHGGTFFVANQSNDLTKKPKDISAIFEIQVPLNPTSSSMDEVRILRYFEPDVIDLSGLQYDEQRDLMYAISDSMDRMMAYTRTGELIQSWNLPGKDQEGLTVDSDGAIYIAQDSGGILKLRIDWERMAKPAKGPTDS